MEIRTLPDFLINQIAAGEVIERPAFIIKELIENAIDAEATEINIIVKNGGKQEIIVSDNGKGMTSNQLKLCIKRHATSKLPKNNLNLIFDLDLNGMHKSKNTPNYERKIMTRFMSELVRFHFPDVKSFKVAKDLFN